jgi:hypothetical protein
LDAEPSWWARQAFLLAAGSAIAGESVTRKIGGAEACVGDEHVVAAPGGIIRCGFLDRVVRGGGSLHAAICDFG